ncbi:hypothetical protein FA95DRAFT_1577762 [Auriscalpium vulgare]|uniref:Uncharacterized protein n=1 Tax=Auriscalpium vulgare TaxID=40419 RepID=A0ACB8R5L0_9AGAM|nr:hypothetical protein FA95DRAFT_1577762 [Auriscalpium vulgare]
MQRQKASLRAGAFARTRIIEEEQGCPMRCKGSASGTADPLHLQDTSLVVLNVERGDITPDAMEKAVKDATELSCEYLRRRIQSHRQSVKMLFIQMKRLRKSVREAKRQHHTENRAGICSVQAKDFPRLCMSYAARGVVRSTTEVATPQPEGEQRLNGEQPIAAVSKLRRHSLGQSSLYDREYRSKVYPCRMLCDYRREKPFTASCGVEKPHMMVAIFTDDGIPSAMHHCARTNSSCPVCRGNASTLKESREVHLNHEPDASDEAYNAELEDLSSSLPVLRTVLASVLRDKAELEDLQAGTKQDRDHQKALLALLQAEAEVAEKIVAALKEQVKALRDRHFIAVVTKDKLLSGDGFIGLANQPRP